MYALNSRMQITKERVSEFGGKSIEIIQPKEQRGKKRLKKEKKPMSSETCVTIIKRSDIHINGVPEEEIKEIDGCRKNI